MLSIVSIAFSHFFLYTSPSTGLLPFERMLETGIVQAEDRIQPKELRAFARESGPARSDELTDALAERYGTPEDCVETVSRERPESVASFGWSDLNTVEEIEICLFHLFSDFNSLREIESWLVQEGFANPFQVDISAVAHLRGVAGELIQFSMQWNTREHGARYGNYWTRRGIERRTSSMDVVVSFSPDVGVVRVSVSHNSIHLK